MATTVSESFLYDLGSSTVRSLQSAQAARRKVSVAASLADLEAVLERAIEVSEKAASRWRMVRRLAPGSIPEPLFEEIRLVCHAGIVLADRIRSTAAALDTVALPHSASVRRLKARLVKTVTALEDEIEDFGYAHHPKLRKELVRSEADKKAGRYIGEEQMRRELGL